MFKKFVEFGYGVPGDVRSMSIENLIVEDGVTTETFLSLIAAYCENRINFNTGKFNDFQGKEWTLRKTCQKNYLEEQMLTDDGGVFKNVLKYGHGKYPEVGQTVTI